MKKYIALCFTCIFLVSCSSIPSVKNGQSLQGYLDSISFSGSVLVSKEGKIIHSAGYGFSDKNLKTSNTPNTQFYIASLTKQFTAMAIMQLQENEKLNINDPIAQYLPNFPNGSLITIKQLLNHSSGLYDFTDKWEEIKTLNISTQNIVDMFKNEPLRFKPGSKVSYSSSGYILAGLLIEKVSGTSYSNYIETHIFKPLKMSSSSYGYSNKMKTSKAIGYKDSVPQQSVNMSIPFSAGGLASSVFDFYLWDRSFYDLSLIGKDSLDYMFPSDRSALGAGFGTGKFKVVMGLGWGIYETDFGAEYSHVGNVDGFSTVVSRYPDEKLLIVILSNEDRFNVLSLKNAIAKYVLSKQI
ncbi:MAG: beta-lactamase family protein [Candidatus Thiodiazotropha sp. (ex Dulcina madagascariensis)]|nr:beta-lactamase family protein [Candidatus Thiodiazotropha sp. (ex Dulcina madagascariensis)]